MKNLYLARNFGNGPAVNIRMIVVNLDGGRCLGGSNNKFNVQAFSFIFTSLLRSIAGLSLGSIFSNMLRLFCCLHDFTGNVSGVTELSQVVKS